MTIGRTNSGSGGGGVGVGAVIIASAPVGSLVIAASGSLSKKVDASKAKVNPLDTSRAFYYFFIPQNQYGTWTVTGLLNGETNTQTVVVSQNEAYDVVIAYPLYLYKYGDTCSSVTGGWYAKAWRWTSNTASAKAPTITYNSDNVVVSIYNGGGAMVTRNAFDVTYYNTFKIRGFYAGDEASPGAILNNTNASYFIDAVAVLVNVGSQSTSDYYGDISSITGQKYFGFEVSKANNTRSLTIYEVVLER